MPSAPAGRAAGSPPAPRGAARRRRLRSRPYPGAAGRAGGSPRPTPGEQPEPPTVCPGQGLLPLPPAPLRPGSCARRPPRASRSSPASEPPARPAAGRLRQAGTRPRRLASAAAGPAQCPRPTRLRCGRGGPAAGRPRADSAPAARGWHGTGRWRRRAGAAPRCRCWRPAGGGSRCGWGPARSCSRWVRGGEGAEGRTVAGPQAGRDASLLSAGPRGGLQEAGWQPWRVRPEVSVAAGPGAVLRAPSAGCPGPGRARGGRWEVRGAGAHTGLCSGRFVPVSLCHVPFAAGTEGEAPCRCHGTPTRAAHPGHRRATPVSHLAL